MKLLEVAISQLGVTEDALHSNHGEAVKYQIAAGLPKGGGFPWCQSFVYWCGLQAYGYKNPVPRTGGVLDCWAKAKAGTQKTLRKSNGPIAADMVHPGYQFILKEGETTGHTGVVESVGPDGRLHTIEGNSNDNKSRDGYIVCRQNKRKISDSDLIGFICYTDEIVAV